MGTTLKVKTETTPSTAHRKKSKGERLGWPSVNEYKQAPLKEIVGNGTIVKEGNAHSTVQKLVL
ncbi:MAG: hypothetical protein LBM06_07300 [Prevotellaceae bacterium]|jgi:hypothetical protein|nr:hypothetical protein [Prevotellaceae bacterium]